MPDDLHILPKIRDSISTLYVDRGRIDKQDQTIAIHDKDGAMAVPVAALSVLMLGPGTTITHAAIRVLAENSCLVIWCGEENVRFYAAGTGGTRSSRALLQQARLASDDTLRIQVVRRMYRMRFHADVPETTSLESLRGMEARRIRDAYVEAAKRFNVPWSGRRYNRGNWNAADPVNRALSCANSCLYGVCHAAILAIGLSPAIGFIHTGKQLSFVYDIADLYKTELTVPLAFSLAAEGGPDLERKTRLACRDTFRKTRLLQRIVPDLKEVLALTDEDVPDAFPADEDPACPEELWEPHLPGTTVGDT